MPLHPASSSIFYRESGRFRVGGAMLMLIGGSLIGSILGIVYAYLIRWIPFVYLNFFLTVFFGLGVGLTIGFFSRMGHARNQWLRLVIGLIAGAISLYVAWVAWLAANGAGWHWNPEVAWVLVKIVNRTGAWSMRDLTPTGAFLWIIWGLEALIVVGIAGWLSKFMVMVYCERCRRYPEETGDLGPFHRIGDPAAFRTLLESGNYEPLQKNLIPLGMADGERATVDVHRCTECGDFCTLTVHQFTVETDRKGREQTEKETLIDNLIIPAALGNELVERFSPAVEAEENEGTS